MNKEIENQQEKLNTLIKLMKENPTLKVVPMVDGEVVGDNCSYWLGNFGKAEIDEVWEDEERIYFKSLDYEDLVGMALECSTLTLKDVSKEELLYMANEEINNLEWETVIVVRIDTP